MSWAQFAKLKLVAGQQAVVTPRGHSMRGKVEDGDSVTLAPCDPKTLQASDIVLVKVKGRDYLHLIKAIQGERFLIGNNRGGINGWVGANCIYGKAVLINGKSI